MDEVYLNELPLVVTVWHQEGCVHCEEFLPRIQAIAGLYADCVPTAFLDTNDNSELADVLGVVGTPSVIVLREGKTIKRWGRGLEDRELETLYDDVGRACVRIAAG
jgi:thioredoxin-like negative regulator of GroEL